MDEFAIALQVLTLAAKLGPKIAAGVEAVMKKERPDLLPDPPVGQSDTIAAEDDARIAARFPKA